MPTQWRAALEKTTGEPLRENGPVAFALLTVEPLFGDGAKLVATVTPGISQRMLSRLSSLRRSSVSRWRETLGTSNIDMTFAALSLVNADGLFVADRFQEDTFGEALPIAGRRILEAKHKER